MASLEQDLAFIGSLSDKSKIGLGFSHRDLIIQQEEKQGSIDYLIIFNDREYSSLRILISLKNLFSRQLPKMPKEYIVRLVFHPEHRSMVIVRNGRELVGGMCYRPFPEQKFAEIVFLAISPNQQIKGYGTRLMNKYKERMQKEGIETLLTYADNAAIGYFKKQGFYKELKFDERVWKGRIKDYDGGTLMECRVHKLVDYDEISRIIASQKEFVIESVKKLCLNSQVFPGINRGLFPLKNIKQINELRYSGYDEHESRQDLPDMTPDESFVRGALNIINLVKKNKNVNPNPLKSWPFLEPVDLISVADYLEIIKEPIDLKAIEERVESDYYENNRLLFVSDLRRIFQNALTYNQEQTIYYQSALDLKQYCEPLISDFLKKP